MHKTVGEFTTLFGKLYVWDESPNGNLILRSVAEMERIMAQVTEIVTAKVATSDA